MAAIENEKIYGLKIRESATDGSDFGTPDADYRFAFLGEDGMWHVKDSGGTVTDPFAGSGSVATDSIWDAKGDLAAGTGSNTAAKLTAGTNDTLLVADSAQTQGLKWAGAPTTWTPALTGSSVNPTLGTGGSTSGRYMQIGKLVRATYSIVFGTSGVAAGTGEYRISLPVSANATTPIVFEGTCVLFDSAPTNTFALAFSYLQSSTLFRLAISGTNLVVQSGAPFTWAANDQINGTITYEAA